MHDVLIEINRMIARGHDARAIATIMEVPLSWVYEAVEIMSDDPLPAGLTSKSQ